MQRAVAGGMVRRLEEGGGMICQRVNHGSSVSQVWVKLCTCIRHCGFAAVPDAYTAPDIAYAREHSVRAYVIMWTKQPAVSPRSHRKGSFMGRDRFGKSQPMQGDPFVFSGMCQCVKG